MASVATELPALTRDQAFEDVYRRYVTDVYHYALALLRNPADAEDVTQTTFMNAYRAFKRGEEIRKPQHWLIKIAHNVARSRYARSGRRVKEVPLDDHLDQLAVPEQERLDVKAVLEALGRLPLNQRAALVMRELEGRSYAEIADTIGVSVPAVETLIFRGRQSMRLKASALRVLGAVPLPGSLAQFLDGGTVVAGGSAAVGIGFLLKAAVAIVAGVVAAGIGSGSGGSHRATPATPHALPRPAETETGVHHVGRGASVRRAHAAVQRVRIQPAGGSSTARSGTQLSDAVRSQAQQTSTQRGLPADQQAAPQPTSTPTTPPLPTASSVTDTVSNVTSAIPVSLPVNTPTLPPPPAVRLPPLP